MARLTEFETMLANRPDNEWHMIGYNADTQEAANESENDYEPEPYQDAYTSVWLGYSIAALSGITALFVIVDLIRGWV